MNTTSVFAYTGANLKDVVAKGVAPWYKGTSFLDHLDKMPMVTRNLSAPLMMPISEKYKDMGTVVVGKVESGHIRKNDSLLLMPNKTLVEVAAITNELEEEVDLGLCGDNVRVRLRGVDDEDISPGFVLTSPSKPVRAVRQFEAQLAILEHKNIICAGYSAVMHIHTTAEEVTLPVRAAYRAHASCSPRPLRRHCSTTLIARRAASRASRRSSPSAGRRSSR
jgi:peptide chain release factor subunit 3